jgi:hypothetical protein
MPTPPSRSTVSQCNSATFVDPQLCVRVATGRTEVDDRDRDPALGRAPYEAIAAEHGERRPGDEEQLRLIEERPRGVERRARHAAAEEHDIGHQHAIAALARDDLEARVVDDHAELRVAVGRDVGHVHRPRRVRGEQPRLQVIARRQVAAREAAHPRERAVQLDDVAAARCLVQAVDVLRDHARDRTGVLERGEGAVAVVGARGGEPWPAHQRARPVALAHLGLLDELAVLHRRARLRRRPAVVGDAGLRRATGAGQRDDAPATRQLDEIVHPYFLAAAVE